MSAAKSSPASLRRQRRQARHRCWGHLVVAPLWVAYGANLGTLLRTCDAVGACIAVPDTPHYKKHLLQGDTLGHRRRPCIHWVRISKQTWIERQREDGWQIIAVELAEGAVSLPRLEPARAPTVVLLGHTLVLVPEDALEVSDVCVEIPMVGMGASLNVTVAGSLVLYKLAGLS